MIIEALDIKTWAEIYICNSQEISALEKCVVGWTKCLGWRQPASWRSPASYTVPVGFTSLGAGVVDEKAFMPLGEPNSAQGLLLGPRSHLCAWRPLGWLPVTSPRSTKVLCSAHWEFSDATPGSCADTYKRLLLVPWAETSLCRWGSCWFLSPICLAFGFIQILGRWWQGAWAQLLLARA